MTGGRRLNQTIRLLNRISELSGSLVAWCLPGMVLMTCVVIFLVTVFDFGRIWIQETVTYMHGILFTSAAAYTLLHNEHVRIDVFYARMSARGQAWVNLLGSLFLLLPVCILIGYTSFPYVFRSWTLFEGSIDAGGIPMTYLLKTFLMVFVLLMSLQGVSMILQSVVTLFYPQERASGDGELG